MFSPFHIGIYTHDIDKSSEFYRAALGFSLTWRGIVHHPTGLVEAAVLRLGGMDIELVKPVDPARVHSEAGPVQHLAFMAPSLDAAIKRFNDMDIPLSSEGVEVLPDFMGGIQHCFIAGPSGERIEICEPLK